MSFCIHCGHKNREGSLFCVECDNLISLRSGRDETQTVSPLQAISQWPKFLPTSYEPGITLMVQTAQGVRSIRLSADKSLVLGRIDRDTLETPDIDLADLGALKYGVSRFHAVIDCTQEVHTLTDLGSRNGTFLNGRQLSPQQSHLLRHGDEIRLGKLVMHLHIQPVVQ